MHCAEAASILLLLYPATTTTTTTTPGEILSWNSGKMVHHRSSSEFMQNRSACHLCVVLGYECGAKTRKTLDDGGFLGNLVALAEDGEGEVRWCAGERGEVKASLPPRGDMESEQQAERETSTKTRYQLAVSTQSVAFFHRLTTISLFFFKFIFAFF
jgi:hypothetical protein